MCKGKFFIRYPPLIYFDKGGGGYVRKSVFLPYVDLSKVHHHWDPKPIAQGGAGGGRFADRLDGGCRGLSAGQPCAARPTGRRAHGEGA